jgi:hypothetical protein
MADDLIRRFCEENRPEFLHPCEHFVHITKICRLLKEQDLQAVFERGRCTPNEMVNAAIKGNLRLYEHLFDSQEARGQYHRILLFETTKRIMGQRLKSGWTIYVLKGYINKTVYCEVIKHLEADGVILKGLCGNCIHLSRSKQFTCENPTCPLYSETRKPADPGCAEGFEAKPTPSGPASADNQQQQTCGICVHLSQSRQYVCKREPPSPKDEGSSSHYGKKRNPSDPACKTGFEPYTLETTAETQTLDRSVDHPTASNILEIVQELLANRAKTETGEKRKRICERQYTVFCRLKQMLSQGVSRREAIETLVKELGESIKTIYLDIQEVHKFLATKNVI